MKSVAPSALDGEVVAPASKSVMQRAVAAAALAHGESVLSNPSECDDAIAALRVAEALGARIMSEPGAVRIVGGASWSNPVLDCGESALCLRLFAPIAAQGPGTATLIGRGSLATRQLGMASADLASLGVHVVSNGGLTPVTLTGPLHGGVIHVDAGETSQLLSGLLMALPCCAEPSELIVTRLSSAPYVRMTLQIASAFGVHIDAAPDLLHLRIDGRQRYQPAALAIEGDYSSAAFVAVAGAIAGQVCIRGLAPSSCQADRAFVDILARAGAFVLQEPERLIVRREALRAFEADLTDAPDLFPPLAALACHCSGTSVLHGASRLRGKESDRSVSIARALGSLGADLRVQGDTMVVRAAPLHGGQLDPQGDHRVAMACAVAALGASGAAAIAHHDCVNKSYPRFFEDLQALGARIR